MKKIRSGVVGLLLGVVVGAFAWVAGEPRPWGDDLPPVAVRSSAPPPADPFPSPQLAASPQSLESELLEEVAVRRRETEPPLVARRLLPDIPLREPIALVSAEEPSDGGLVLSPPSAPVFAAAEETHVATEIGSSDHHPADLVTVWPQARALLTQLDALRELAVCRRWAEDTRTQVCRLANVEELDSPEAAVALERLSELTAEADSLAADAAPDEQARLSAASYALSRRLAVWRHVHTLAGDVETYTIPVSFSPDQMLRRLEAADAVLAQSSRSSDWRRYLLTAQTRLLAEAGASVDPQQRCRHAQRVLRRMEWSGLTSSQRKFLERPEFQDLAEELRAWAAEPFDFSLLLETLEEYEEQPSAVTARRIADFRRRLSWASHRSVAELADHFDAHYRNANIRAAVSQDLLELLTPENHSSVERVHDEIAGAAVRGQSRTTSEVAFRVLPDPQRLRLVLEAKGQAVTTARSSKSGAVFYSNSRAWFVAEKEILFDGGQVTMKPAVARARVLDNLRDVETDYDAVPLVNALAQSLARQGHADARQTARREAEHKVARRAARRLDEEAEKHLAELEGRLQNRVGQTLASLALQPAPIGLESTQSRLVGRYRLAGDSQLGAHTVRPLAPGDSLVSVQVHESAVNNALNRLPLAGKELDLPSLFNEVASAVGAARWTVPDDLPKDIVVRFDEDEPLRVDLIDGRARVTIRLAELESDSDRWRNVMSRAYYRPKADGLSARLVRDGHIELTGHRLRLRDQFALRAIFAKVFSESRALELLPPKVAGDPRLQACEVTQLVIRDGWLGFALGPQRPRHALQTAKK